MYIESSKCALCRQEKELTSGQSVIKYRDLATVGVRSTEITVLETEHPLNGGPSTRRSLGSFPVVGYCVVDFDGRETIETVFLDEGQLLTQTQFRIANHVHGDSLMTTASFTVFRVRDV